ncbi:YozE family protein [Salinibacillus xinjiangensis]|uniref:YozE family protein n=1 Tax=Salinibacillus xinjiangensis TaxID=1229268 RepID=A0A6G1XBN7_9BACI|nr:YozE family protein [Salinibacillus xinjiangensis]MRG88316.1 YozE family protein [Salinibacillus xinjiangensis]
MRSFYHFMMKYRGMGKGSEERRLADWMFEDHDFPKQSTSYDEISRYLEWNSPFSSALHLFDQLWEVYEAEEF